MGPWGCKELDMTEGQTLSLTQTGQAVEMQCHLSQKRKIACCTQKGRALQILTWVTHH